MITPWRYALASAKFKKKVLPIFLAFKLVTIRVFFLLWVALSCVSPNCFYCRACGRRACAADANFHLCVSLTGDILASINGVNTDGFSHKQIVDLIKSSGNYLR